MRTKPMIRTFLALLAAALACGTVAAAAAMRNTKVSYLAGRSVYLEAGEAEGLAVGDSVWVVRGGDRVAALRVAFVSSHRSSCDTLWTRGPLAVGDAATFRPDLRRLVAVADSANAVAARDDSVRAKAVLAPPKGRAAVRESSFRGRIGARWLGVDAEEAGRTSQPGVEVRFDARDGLGGHADASLDMRGRRTLRTGASGEFVEQYSRVYRASATLRDRDGRARLTLGRQSSPTLASVSLFDGALAEWSGKRHGIGVFGGTQPDPLRFAWSREVIEAGAFAEVHQAPLAAHRWSIATGAVSSRHGAEVDRDFMFLQGWWFSKALTASVAQEVDANLGWKRTAGEPPLSWTSTFATVRLPIGQRVALLSGYDNRRNVRLWRDRETPETDFDDRYRQGAWGGANVDWTDHLSSGGEYRVGSGSDRSATWSVNGQVHRLTHWHGLLRGRYSSFSSDATASDLWTAAAGLDPFARSHLEVSAGSRSTRDRLVGVEDTERWVGVDLDVALGQRWYANGGYERLTGAAGGTRQFQAGLSVRL